MSAEVLVHKAVEPEKLSVAGKARFEALVNDADRRILQPKYDGVYAQFSFERWHGWTAYSRTGELLRSVGGEILQQFDAHALRHMRYAGELWLPYTQHAVINGLARKQTPQHLELRLFDAFDPDSEGTYLPYTERYGFLFGAAGSLVSPVRNLSEEVSSFSDMMALAAKFKNSSSAYDGLILRDADAPYIPGPGKGGEIIKIKPRQDGDFRVVGVTHGKGNRAGGVGALVLDLGGGVTCEVGSGLNNNLVHETDPRSIYGRIAKVEYLGVTKDGRLREPVFIAFRYDKVTPDVLPGNVPQED